MLSMKFFCFNIWIYGYPNLILPDIILNFVKHLHVNAESYKRNTICPPERWRRSDFQQCSSINETDTNTLTEECIKEVVQEILISQNFQVATTV